MSTMMPEQFVSTDLIEFGVREKFIAECSPALKSAVCYLSFKNFIYLISDNREVVREGQSGMFREIHVQGIHLDRFDYSTHVSCVCVTANELYVE